MIRIRAPQELGASAIFFGTGFVGLLYGSKLGGMQEDGQLGSGTVPFLLSCICIAFGMLMLIRAVRIDGPPVDAIPWRGLVAVTIAIVAFGGLVETFGYLPAAIATPLIASLGLSDVRWKEAVLVAVVLGVAGTILFVVLLGQPIKVWGSY
jgi:hypothetical protein